MAPAARSRPTHPPAPGDRHPRDTVYRVSGRGEIDPLMTLPEAARVCGLGARSRLLRDAVRRGELRVTYLSDRSWPRVSVAELRRWLTARRAHPTSHAEGRLAERLAHEARARHDEVSLDTDRRA